MKFELVPIINIMKEMYEKPISGNRFKEYISKLQGNTKGDLSLPIGGFNPMAKEHILQKLDELTQLKAEKIIKETLNKLNKSIKNKNALKTIQVVLNLADDLKGGWTNYYTTDFDSKFKINALVTRNFCTPYFWTSENYSEELIIQRTLAYAYRTIYWLNNSKPITLKEHLKQEVFVAKKMNYYSNKINYNDIKQFYINNKDNDDYSIIFNFFYGDKASKSLEFPVFGVKELTGFDFAKVCNLS